jgi:hypothetical protein
MLLSGSVLPTRIGASRPAITWSPILQALRRDDVTALTVDVAQQRDVRGAVRIVFDALDAGGDADLVALEVDDAVMLLVATTDVTRGDAAVVVAATVLPCFSTRPRAARPCAGPASPRGPALRRPAEVGLKCHQCHGSILRPWPSRRSTGLRPASRTPCANRRGGPAELEGPWLLPFTFTTLTASTLTRTASHATLMSALVASSRLRRRIGWNFLQPRGLFGHARCADACCRAWRRSCQPLLDLLDRSRR